MVQTTSPDNINKWTNGDPTSIVQASQSQGDSVQAAFSKRQRYAYVWPTSSERTAQTGMIQGSMGYQVDTKSDYVYDNSAWRLSVGHIELTASISQTTAYAGNGIFSVDSTPTTDPLMASGTATSGRINITYPGVYAITATVVWTPSSGSPGNGTLDIATSAAATTAIIRSRSLTFNDLLSAAIGNYRTTTANQAVFINGNVNPAVTADTRVRITRLG